MTPRGMDRRYLVRGNPNYSANLNLKTKVLDFVKSGGPTWMVGSAIFEMWLGAHLPRPSARVL